MWTKAPHHLKPSSLTTHPAASGLQLHRCSLTNVILGGYAQAAGGPAAKVEGTATEVDVPGAAEAITTGALR